MEVNDDIWKKLNEIYKLEEQAYLNESNLTDHHIKHVIIRGNIGDNKFPENMTKEEYNVKCFYEWYYLQYNYKE